MAVIRYILSLQSDVTTLKELNLPLPRPLLEKHIDEIKGGVLFRATDVTVGALGCRAEDIEVSVRRKDGPELFRYRMKHLQLGPQKHSRLFALWLQYVNQHSIAPVK